jgi:hypothetical protein
MPKYFASAQETGYVRLPRNFLQPASVF